MLWNNICEIRNGLSMEQLYSVCEENNFKI